MAAKTEAHRCWPGYEPVPGKRKNQQGSCRPKAESKLTKSEIVFRKKRNRQLDAWEERHPLTRRTAAQSLAAPGARKAPSKAAAKGRATASGHKRAAN